MRGMNPPYKEKPTKKKRNQTKSQPERKDGTDGGGKKRPGKTSSIQVEREKDRTY